MKKQVLGVNIDDITMDQATDKVVGWLKKPGPASPAKRGEKHYIVTPNPEILVMAQKDTEYRNTLNNADLAIPDGVGLKLSGDIVCHIPGTDFLERLVEIAGDLGFTTGFLGGQGSVAKETADCLRKKYPKIKVIFAESGGEIDDEGNEIATLPLVARNDKTIDLLFVAFGPPKQEKWIAKNLDKIPVKVAMGVGGAFDYLSGRVPRAPKWLRVLGMEWLFRLIVQPWRLKRQLALVKYLWLLVV